MRGTMQMTQTAGYSGLAAAIPDDLPRKWTVLVILLAAPFLAVLDGFIVTIAAPSIQDRLHASNAGVQMVVAGYVVAYAAFLITGGRLGDVHGRRKLLAYGIAPPLVTSSRRALFGVEQVACPQCGSDDTGVLSEFGSTSCKALWRCKSCREPFDYFKCH